MKLDMAAPRIEEEKEASFECEGRDIENEIRITSGETGVQN